MNDTQFNRNIEYQQKWLENDRNDRRDIVLFLENDSSYHSIHQCGGIQELFPARGSKFRKVVYINRNENVFSQTDCAFHELVVINQVDEIGLVDVLNEFLK